MTQTFIELIDFCQFALYFNKFECIMKRESGYVVIFKLLLITRFYS